MWHSDCIGIYDDMCIVFKMGLYTSQIQPWPMTVSFLDFSKNPKISSSITSIKTIVTYSTWPWALYKIIPTSPYWHRCIRTPSLQHILWQNSAINWTFCHYRGKLIFSKWQVLVNILNLKLQILLHNFVKKGKYGSFFTKFLHDTWTLEKLGSFLTLTHFLHCPEIVTWVEG